MMKHFAKSIGKIAGFLLAVFLIFGLFWLIFPKAGNRIDQPKMTSKAGTTTLHYTALGDSLTEGVGDATKQGGFVPLFAKDIEQEKKVSVQSDNYGKAGDTSEQILERMTSQSKITDSLKNANVITLTVGGNDVLKVIRDNIDKISTLKAEDFKEPSKTYQAELQKIFSEIRKYNSHAQIYVLGIYNPFYLNFPQITVMQEVINQWNQATTAVVKGQDKSRFVAINDLLYKGQDGQKGIADAGADSQSGEKNDLLYAGDHFHPNNIGYQIMAQAVFEAYQGDK
ncbi:SGNH/GDSL hydrolase family protein [Lactococcus termiticola]|uniref:Lipase n=1 Tax=Lactococcus termiticola TaxID=2169526 RepID=A0A2R5HHE0_9LACT|nr:SGNH/GDSL hydrolase family protein [Lactococcus termiticola]GBG97266.1 lipase [Lactococcus termiticola]